MPWARASALHRHLDCPAASWLPRLDRGVWSTGYLALDDQPLPEPPDALPDTSAADWGTAMHDAKAANAAASEPWLSMVDPVRERLWPADMGVHEQLMAYDCATGKVELGPANVSKEEGDAWKAQWGPSWVVGTTDWWAELPSGEPWIDDLKTGWRTPEVATPPMLFYLMCKCKVVGKDFGRLSITHWPKRAEAPTREGLWRQVGPLVLTTFEADLQRAWRKTMASPESRPGPGCSYCPSAGACDKATGLAA
jgi:hypothetical protein